MRCYYRCQYYFNARHSFDGKKEKAHAHTFTILLYLGFRNKEEQSANMSVADTIVTDFLKNYENRYLNELDGFQNTKATLEDIGNLFYEKLKELFRKTKLSLYQLDIAENPLSVYQVADRILLPTLNMDNSKNNYDAILHQKEQLREQHGKG